MDDTRSRILKATYKAVRQYGLDGVRIQNISELAGLSPGALYRYFDSKETLLEVCFDDVEKRVEELFDQMDRDWEKALADPAGLMRMVWLTYFRFWVSRPDETVFFNSFHDAPGFRVLERERDTSYFQVLDSAFERTKEAIPELRKMDQRLLYIHVLCATVMYAKYVVEGVLPDNEQTEDEIFRLLITGLTGFMRSE